MRRSDPTLRAIAEKAGEKCGLTVAPVSDVLVLPHNLQ
jgi:hypothetical protein